jgi:signal transduction histidine kinase
VIKDVLTKISVASLHANSPTPIDIVFEPHDDPLIVFADKLGIFEVLSNLMDNAIKFSNSESITISVTRFQDDKDKANQVHPEELENGESGNRKKKNNQFVLVSIKDKGKGIDKEILSGLFNKFITKSDQGTGLGLYIAKSIVEAHGGRIWTQNNENEKGATFSFSLPLGN